MRRSLRATLLPFLAWFPVSRAQVRADLVAGITVALILVPQSMAYAQLAGMPAYYGLYAAFLPVAVGALWGSSRQLATGPVAIVALLTASSLAPFAAPGSEQFVALAIMLALMVGLIQLALGLFRLGAIVNLLSHPVIIGFTNAAAIIIALSQLNKLLGVPMSRSDSFLSDIAAVLEQAGDTHLPALAMGLGALAIMLGLRHFLPRWPNVLIAVALTTLVSWQIGYERRVTVEAGTIQNAEARGLVEELAAAKQQIDALNSQLAEQRTRLRGLIKAEDGVPGHVPTLEYAVQLTQLELAGTTRTSKGQMQALRDMHFVLVDDGSGQRALHRATEMPPGVEADPRRWRVERVDATGVHLSGGGEVVGVIPSGLPALALPRLSWDGFSSLFAAAVVIALIGFMESISIAKAMAARTRDRIDPNQELIGQGLANLAGSLSQSFPVSGSFSRSAVNLKAGAVTGLSSIFAAAVVLVTLLLLTDLLYHLPQAVLAAVIMLAVFGLITPKSLWHAWQTQRHDGVAALATFGATLAFAPHLDRGILFGAFLAIMLFLKRRMRPRAEILGLHPDGFLGAMDAERLPPVSEHFVVIRFDAALIFINTAYFEDVVLEALNRFPKARAILVIGSGIHEVDVSGEEKIRSIAERLDKIGVALYLSSFKKQVMEVFERTRLTDVIPPEHIFKTKAQALLSLRERYDAVEA